MYDFYPEWGPAKHRADDTSSFAALQAPQGSLDLRDDEFERPDDN